MNGVPVVSAEVAGYRCWSGEVGWDEGGDIGVERRGGVVIGV